MIVAGFAVGSCCLAHSSIHSHQADPLPVQFAKRVRLVAQCGRVLACIIREPSRGQLGSTVTTSPAISGWPPDPGGSLHLPSLAPARSKTYHPSV